MINKGKKVADWHKRTKQRLVEAFDGKCGICGYSKSIRALHFHHINSEDKKFGISGRFKSWEKIISEAEKCCLLCSNCHMEVHDGVTEIPSDIRRFNFDYREYDSLVPCKITDECPICGKQKPRSQKSCSVECNSIKQRKTVRPSKEELEDMIQKFSWVYIGRIYCVSDNAIRKWAKKYGII